MTKGGNPNRPIFDNPNRRNIMKKIIALAIVAAGVGVYAANYTPVTAEGTAATATITTATIGTANVGTSLVLTNTGTIKMSGVTCVTSNLVIGTGATITNTLTIVDGLITAIQ
jgi:PhoPQ-activated pathogenicity-related protein